MHKKLSALCMALSLTACATQTSAPAVRSASARHDATPFAGLIESSLLDPPEGMRSESHSRASEAVRFITQNNLPRASRAINAALQLDDRNSWLHFLNGFVYHLQARQGDSQKNELAIEGYRTALRLDHGNWIAQEFLGLAYLDLKQYKQAREQFAQALLMAPDTTVSMYGLMVTSYLAGDPRMACAMADRYRQSTPRPQPAFLHSSVSVYASCGNFDLAEEMRGELRSQKADAALVQRADQRLLQWKALYQAPKAERVSYGSSDSDRVRLAQAFTITPRPTPPPLVQPMYQAPPMESSVGDADSGSLSTSPDAGSSQSTFPDEGFPATGAPGDGSTPGMVLVDVVIVSMQETISTSKGINLLNALTLQLGSATAPGYSWNFDSASDNRTVITKAVTVPALAYSLNIANSNTSRNEVLARPTLAAIENQPSQFFAGINVNAGVVSTTTLGSPSVVPVDKRFGVTLSVTPNFLPDGMVKLKVGAQRTFVMQDSGRNVFAYRFDIAETSTDANVVMKLGDTLVLSGLSERETSVSRDGVPGLQDVPGVQYLFGSKQKVDLQHSALILITPRAPIYGSKADAAAWADGTSESVQALSARLGFPDALPANVESIVASLNSTELFRQFRQGDVSMERWDHVDTTGERLKQALSFLYY